MKDTTPETLKAAVEIANQIPEWQSLAHSLSKNGSSHLCGWHHGTYWIDGTPATILGWKLRGQELLKVNFTN